MVHAAWVEAPGIAARRCSNLLAWQCWPGNADRAMLTWQCRPGLVPDACHQRLTSKCLPSDAPMDPAGDEGWLAPFWLAPVWRLTTRC